MTTRIRSLTHSLKALTLLLPLAAVMHSTAASAFFDVEVLAGKRWYKISGAGADTNVASQEIDIAAHIDPIPLIPVAFGASAAIGTLRKGDLGTGIDEAKTFEGNVDIMAWIPAVPVVTPYVRVKIPVVGTMLVKDGTDSRSYKTSGYHVNLGIKYSPLPIIKFLFEVGMGQEKIKEDEVKVADVKVAADSKSYDLKSNTVMLGVEIGL